MKSRCSLTVAFCMTVVFVSCKDIHFTREGYIKAVRSGFKLIPEAQQIEEILGDSDHFISYNGSLELGNEWNTEVFFGGRYCLTMQVPVKMDRAFDRVLAVLGPAKFDLVEIERIDDDGLVRYNPKAERRFTATEWAKIYKAKGDFSVIGIKLKKGPPVKNFEKSVGQVRKDRIKVRP